MTKQETPKFEGNLVYVMDDGIDPASYVGLGPAYFSDTKNPFQRISANVLDNIAGEVIRSTMADEIAGKRAELEQFKSQFSEISRILKQGRVRISILLNSTGGYDAEMQRALRLIEHLRSNGGELFTFGSYKIFSAAAELFVSAHKPNRHTSKESHLLFHMPNTAYGEPLNDVIRHYMDTANDFIRSDDNFMLL